MTETNPTGTLGALELLTFTAARNSEAVELAIAQLGFSRIEIHAGGVIEASAYLAQHASPEALLVEITSTDNAAAQLDALAEVLHPMTRVIVCGTIDSVRFYHWLLEIGIHEYLLEPFSEQQLATALKKSSKARVDPTAEASADKPRSLIAVIGARGGVGTTSIAVNMAGIFVQARQLPTALFDLDPYFGSVALNLDMEPGRGIRDAFEKPDRVDGLFLERVMVKPFANLALFAAEEPLADPLQPQPNAAERIIAALQEKYEMVVVDVPRQMTPLTRHVMSVADHVCIVAGPYLPDLRDALRLRDYRVDVLKRSAPRLVINGIGAHPGQSLSMKSFTKHFGAAPDCQLPHVPEAVTATAEGALFSANPKLQVLTLPLRLFALSLLGEEMGSKETRKPTPPKKSSFSFLQKKR